MRTLAPAVALALSVIACKKKPDPAELAAAASASAAAQVPAAAPASSGESLLSGFEGRIKLAVKGRLGGGQDKPLALDLTLLVKDGKVRVDVPPSLAPSADMGPVHLIVEPNEKKVYAVMEAKKQAMLFDLEKLTPQLEAMAKTFTAKKTSAPSGAGGGGALPQASMTGKHDKVAGLDCEIWQVLHEGRRLELCVKTDDKAWLKLPEVSLPPQLLWAKDLTDGRHLPLRYVAFEADGTEAGRVELTSLERTTLSAADLEVPKGFVIVSFDQMMGGLGGLLGGAGGLPGIKGLPPGFKLPPGIALPSGLPRMPAPPQPPPSAKPRKP